MTDEEHLANAPIVEAALDVQLLPGTTLDLEQLAPIQARLGTEYTNKQVRIQWTGEFNLQNQRQPVAKSTSSPAGYLFGTSDGTRAVIPRRDGFTFSRLKPYHDWEELSTEARAAWDIYAEVAKPKKIFRIALRYINRLELPKPVTDITKYLMTAPTIAPGVSQQLDHFFLRVEITDAEFDAHVAVTETVDRSNPTKDYLAVIFDTDTFRVGSFPTDTAKLWPLFEPLHTLKNKVFFRSLTDLGKDLFR